MNTFAKSLLMRVCVYFTIAMIFCIIAGLIFVGADQGIMISISLLVVCALMVLLQGLWFTDKLLKKPSYPVRIFGFGVTGFVVLALCAWIFEWMPHDIPEAWISFTVIYLVILGAFCVGYQVRFKRTCGSFDAALRAYHEQEKDDDMK